MEPTNHATAQASSSTRQLFSDIADKWRNIPVETPEQLAKRDEAERDAAAKQETYRRQGWFTDFLRQAGDSAKEYRFNTYEAKSPYQKRCADAVADWANGGKESLQTTRNLVLHGPVGTGKDHLAVAACRTLCLKHGVRTGFISVQDWFGRIRDAIDDNESERQIIGEAASYDLLVLSDPIPPFGNLTQHQATMFYRLVERRSSLRRAIIVTVNVATDLEAYERLGAPTWNRLIDDALMIHCNWESHRQPRQRITNVKVNQ